MSGQKSGFTLHELKVEAVRILRHAGATHTTKAVYEAATPAKLIVEINKSILRTGIQGSDRGDLENLKRFAQILANNEIPRNPPNN